MAPLDATARDAGPQPACDGFARDLGFLAEHYLRNQRPRESFALLSFLEELRVEDLRLKKMLVVAAIEIRNLDVARRLIGELGALDGALAEEERRILDYYGRRLASAERAGEWP